MATCTDMRPILILKTGCAVDSVRALLGDFEEWFAAALGKQLTVKVVDCTRDLPPAGPESYAGIIVTGSVAMVSQREEWSEQTGAWLKEAVAKNVPILGVCYGHQLLAQAMGGTVGLNPKGRQIGSREVYLTDEGKRDALLCTLPEHFFAQVSHLESVLSLPQCAVRLAGMDADKNYAFRIGENAWGVQFHPEFSAQATRGYIKARREALVSEGLDPDQLYSGVQDTPLAHTIINRFAQLATNPLLRAS